jgi:Mg-chelatase subunit ChlD
MLQDADRAAVISFATSASNPPDEKLSADRNLIKQAISRIAIGTGSTQQTNIADVLSHATDELFSARHTEGSRRVVVVLTDGIANYPRNDTDPSYGERYALTMAAAAKTKGILVYTIGLGKEVNVEFLKNIASKPENYYAAATPALLGEVYRQIATSICRKSATARIDITPLLFPGVNY